MMDAIDISTPRRQAGALKSIQTQVRAKRVISTAAELATTRVVKKLSSTQQHYKRMNRQMITEADSEADNFSSRRNHYNMVNNESESVNQSAFDYGRTAKLNYS